HGRSRDRPAEHRSAALDSTAARAPKAATQLPRHLSMKRSRAASLPHPRPTSTVSKLAQSKACSMGSDAGRRMAHDVRFGSKADIARDQLNVRFTPKSGHWNSTA